MTATLESPRVGRLIDQFELGLDAPICLTWELTYACNLACVYCLSSSGKRDPRELSTEQCKAVIDELQRMQVFYVNIGGGEPTVRSDFWELVDYATAHQVGIKFSTNGVKIDRAVAARIAGSDYVDVQISLDGATAEVNDAVRGTGSFDLACRALQNLSDAGFRDAKISVVCTRHNIGQLDQFKALADRFGATLRLTRLRPAGRGADVWNELHPTMAQQRELYDWLVAHGEGVLTGDSFFHLAAFGDALPGLNLCGAGRVVCLIDRSVTSTHARSPSMTHSSPETCWRPVDFRRYGSTRSCSPSCAPRRPAGRAPSVSTSTPAAADAWPPSSSPGCRWTGPTRSACRVTARWRWSRPAWCPRPAATILMPGPSADRPPSPSR